MSEEEVREAAEEKPARRAAKPVKKMPEKASPKTVKGKIAAIQKQMNENKEAVAIIYSGVRAIQSAISEQMNENKAFIRDFYG